MKISKKMLMQSVELSDSLGMDADRKTIYSPPIKIDNVFIDLTNGQTNGTNGKEVSDIATLYYDCVNSFPTGIKFKKDSKITYGEVDYFVNTINPCYGLSGLEHLEIGLV